MPLTARAETSIMPERAPAERGTAPAGLGLGQGLAAGQRQRVYLDLTHLGRHVTGIERVTIEQFEKVAFEGADVHHVRSKGVLTMILAQQLWLPLLALLHPRAIFVFPGFPPSPFFRLVRERVVMYVHDLFLLTRRQDLGRKAKLYMAWPFGVAVKGLKHFLVNSEKTRAELEPFVSADADIGLYRPAVRNVFALSSVFEMSFIELRSRSRPGSSYWRVERDVRWRQSRASIVSPASRALRQTVRRAEYRR